MNKLNFIVGTALALALVAALIALSFDGLISLLMAAIAGWGMR